MQEAARAQDLASAARRALNAARAKEASGLTGEAQAVTEARLIGIEDGAAGAVTIRLASDGLSLEAKLAIEQAVKAEMLSAAVGTAVPASVAVYFKRLAPAAEAEAGPRRGGPAPLKNRKSPFGLTIDRRAIPGVTEIIVVASGKGGVGKSTVSSNLAVALAASGAKVGLLDADIYGPSAPLMMGLAGKMPVTDGAQLVPLEAHGVKVVSFGFLTDTRQPVIWRGPLLAKALKQLCYDVRWGELDYLVIDLPPGTGDVQIALIETVPVHHALIVTTPQDVALLDAHKAVTMFEKLEVPVLGIVENMAHHICSNCGHSEPIFGEGGADRMALERKLKVIGRLPLHATVRSRGDAGRPIALDAGDALGQPFADLARQVRAACS